MKKNRLTKVLSTILIAITLVLLSNPLEVYAARPNEMIDYSDHSNEDYLNYINPDGIAFFDGVDKIGKWETIYVEDKETGEKTYLDQMMSECGFTQIESIYREYTEVKKNQYSLKFYDQSGNYISFFINIDPDRYTNREGNKAWYDRIALENLVVNGQIAKCDYVEKMMSSGFSKTHPLSEYSMYKYGLDTKINRYDILKERKILRNINNGFFKLGRINNEQGDMALLIYNDENGNLSREDDSLDTLNRPHDMVQTTTIAELTVAYFDKAVGKKDVACTSLDGVDYSLNDMMVKCGFSKVSMTYNYGRYSDSESFNYVYTDELKRKITISVSGLNYKAYDSNDKLYKVREYIMSTPIIDGRRITYAEWQEWKNKAFIYTHNTNNCTRRMIEQNLINKFGDDYPKLSKDKIEF